MGTRRIYKNIALISIIFFLIIFPQGVSSSTQPIKIGLAVSQLENILSINQGIYFLEISMTGEMAAFNDGSSIPIRISNRNESTYSIMIGAFPRLGLYPYEGEEGALKALIKLKELGFQGTIVAFNLIPGYVIEVGRFNDLLEAELFRLRIAQYFPEATILPTLRKGLTITHPDFEIFFPTFENQPLQNLASLKPFGSGLISLNKKLYRGAMNIVWSSNQENFHLINELPIEEYLLGVVPSEMPDSFLIEALKTQAITARTYALKNRGRFAKEGYDLCDTSLSQVYGGFSAEKPNSTQAVKDTFGIVLSYQNQLANTFYHSTSGGKTEKIENVWGGSPIPYLVSVESPYETMSPHYEWVRTFSSSETSSKINRLLSDRGLKAIGNVVNIQVLTRGASPRIITARITGDKDNVEVSGGFLKSALGLRETWAYFEFDGGPGKIVNIIGKDNIIYERILGEVLNNTLLTGLNSITLRGKEIETRISLNWQIMTVKGRGWGHGVGMSQWGAYGMSQAGWNYEKILGHFYPGTFLNKIY